jgi:hypothetical protein
MPRWLSATTVDATTGSNVNRAILNAILRPYLQVIAGTPRASASIPTAIRFRSSIQPPS